MKKISINNVDYEIIYEKDDSIDKELLGDRITDYFDDFDYIVGDYAYGKLRLKGFYDTNNKKRKEYNDIAKVKDYIENKCAFGCKWFELKRIK